jgi:hypothetical protein
MSGYADALPTPATNSLHLVAVEHPLNGGKIGAKCGAQIWQWDCERGTIDERHGGRERAAGEHHMAAHARDFVALQRFGTS